MSEKNALKMLKQILDHQDDDDNESEVALPPLEEMVADYNTRHTFKAGDLVQWKKGMKINTLPKYGQEAIVVEVLETPVIDDTEDHVGSPYWMERHDIRIGVKQKQGFMIYHFDSRRFEPVEKKKH